MAKTRFKTAAEWFAEFPEWSDKARANAIDINGQQALDLYWPSAHKAVKSSFLFAFSPEGEDFWFKILDGLEPNP